MSSIHKKEQLLKAVQHVHQHVPIYVDSLSYHLLLNIQWASTFLFYWLFNCPLTLWFDWSTFWLAYWLTDWLHHSLTGSLTDWQTDWLYHWLTGKLNEWLFDLITYWPAPWLTDKLIDFITDWLVSGLTWVIVFITDRLTYGWKDRLTCSLT